MEREKDNKLVDTEVPGLTSRRLKVKEFVSRRQNCCITNRNPDYDLCWVKDKNAGLMDVTVTDMIQE